MNMDWLVAAWGRILGNCARFVIKIFLEAGTLADVRSSETNSNKFIFEVSLRLFYTVLWIKTLFLVAVWQPFVISLGWFAVGVMYNNGYFLYSVGSYRSCASSNCSGKHVHSLRISREVKICNIWHSNGLFVKKRHLARSNKLAFHHCSLLLAAIERSLLKRLRLGIISRLVYFFDSLRGLLYAKFRNFSEREDIKDIVNITDIVNSDLRQNLKRILMPAARRNCIFRNLLTSLWHFIFGFVACAWSV